MRDLDVDQMRRVQSLSLLNQLLEDAEAIGCPRNYFDNHRGVDNDHSPLDACGNDYPSTSHQRHRCQKRPLACGGVCKEF